MVSRGCRLDRIGLPAVKVSAAEVIVAVRQALGRAQSQRVSAQVGVDDRGDGQVALVDGQHLSAAVASHLGDARVAVIKQGDGAGIVELGIVLVGEQRIGMGGQPRENDRSGTDLGPSRSDSRHMLEKRNFRGSNRWQSSHSGGRPNCR